MEKNILKTRLCKLHMPEGVGFILIDFMSKISDVAWKFLDDKGKKERKSETRRKRRRRRGKSRREV